MIITTAQKIALATIAYRLVTFGRGMLGLSQQVETTRGGVRWRLDLREGIDFSIYLLGGFEPATLQLYRRLVTPGDVVLDIGANIGSHTLPLAQLVEQDGRVLAFEPTCFAIDKLRANAALNPDLQPRIEVCQLMLVARTADAIEGAIYSSWPLTETEDLHEQHRGRLMSTEGAKAVTLDEFLSQRSIDRINFIKIDVDGNEPAVLAGAEETLKRHKPKILMELAPYLFRDHPEELRGMLQVLDRLGYVMSDANTGRDMPRQIDALLGSIPDGASRNVLMAVR